MVAISVACLLQAAAAAAASGSSSPPPSATMMCPEDAAGRSRVTSHQPSFELFELFIFASEPAAGAALSSKPVSSEEAPPAGVTTEAAASAKATSAPPPLARARAPAPAGWFAVAALLAPAFEQTPAVMLCEKNASNEQRAAGSRCSSISIKSRHSADTDTLVGRDQLFVSMLWSKSKWLAPYKSRSSNGS